MDQLRQTVRLVRDALGPNLLGVYLHGSAVLGGELAPASDLDVLAVTRRSMDEEERRHLLACLLRVSGCTRTVRPVELTVVVHSEIRPWRYPPVGDFLFGEWLREEFLTGGLPAPGPVPDLALVLSVVLKGDHPVHGPPPARLLDPVPRADLVRACVEGLPSLLDDLEGDTRNVLLTLARIWTTLATGEIRTKSDAAEWALARLPEEHRPPLKHARDLYLTRHYEDEVWDEPLKARVRPHVDEVRARIESLTPHRDSG